MSMKFHLKSSSVWEFPLLWIGIKCSNIFYEKVFLFHKGNYETLPENLNTAFQPNFKPVAQILIKKWDCKRKKHLSRRQNKTESHWRPWENHQKCSGDDLLARDRKARESNHFVVLINTTEYFFNYFFLFNEHFATSLLTFSLFCSPHPLLPFINPLNSSTSSDTHLLHYFTAGGGQYPDPCDGEEREVNLSFVKSRYYNYYYYYYMSIFAPCVSRKTIIWKKQKLEVKFRIVFFHRHWKVNVTVYPKMNASKYGWSTKSSKERTRLFSQTTVEHLFYLSHVMRPHFQGKKKPNQVFKLLNIFKYQYKVRCNKDSTGFAGQAWQLWF